MKRRVSPEVFMAYWQRVHPDTPLQGHALRERFPERWLRIHSLPGSKRYPEDEAEYAELLDRQNEVIGAVLGDGAACQLVFGYFGEEQRMPAELLAFLRRLHPVFLATLEGAEAGLVEDFPLLTAPITWRANRMDVVLRAIAADVLETPLIVALEHPSIVAPYDGGVDLIARDRDTRESLEARYAAWRSTHPSGL